MLLIWTNASELRLQNISEVSEIFNLIDNKEVPKQTLLKWTRTTLTKVK